MKHSSDGVLLTLPSRATQTNKNNKSRSSGGFRGGTGNTNQASRTEEFLDSYIWVSVLSNT